MTSAHVEYKCPAPSSLLLWIFSMYAQECSGGVGGGSGGWKWIKQMKKSTFIIYSRSGGVRNYNMLLVLRHSFFLVRCPPTTTTASSSSSSGSNWMYSPSLWENLEVVVVCAIKISLRMGFMEDSNFYNLSDIFVIVLCFLVRSLSSSKREDLVGQSSLIYLNNIFIFNL